MSNCGKSLTNTKNGQIIKMFEVAHIYPANPRPDEIELLKDEERLSKDVNSLDNVIAVCRICHKKFDTPRTIEEYRSWVRLKKKLLQDAQLKNTYGLLVGDTRGAMREIQSWPRHYVAQAYQDWLYTQEHPFDKQKILDRRRNYSCRSWLADVPEIYSNRAPGNTCLSALSAQKNGKGLAKDYVKEPQNRSKGCGGIMRVAPVALNYKRVEIDTLDMEGCQIAAITHGHSLGYMPAAIVTHIINRIVFGEEKKTLKNIVIEARDKVAEIFRGDKHLKELTDIIDLAIELSGNEEDDLDNIHRLGEGWGCRGNSRHCSLLCASLSG